MLSVGDLVTHQPISNSGYTRKTEGVVLQIERMSGCKDKDKKSYWITIRQTKPLKGWEQEYPIGRKSCIGYGGSPVAGTGRDSLWRSWSTLTYLRRYEMNKVIIEAYPKTKDAVLVDKHFGHRLDDPLFALLLRGKEKDLLQEAKKLELEEEK